MENPPEDPSLPRFNLKTLEELLSQQSTWSNDYIELINEQKDIIDQPFEKNIFVEATAGSGKTRTLVCKVKKLIFELKSLLKIKKILILTFSKAATTEIKLRLEKTYGKLICKYVNISTIHSFCLQIANQYRNIHSKLEIFPIEQEYSQKLIRKILNDAKFYKISNEEQGFEIVQSILHEIYVKKKKLSEIEDSVHRELFEEYQKKKKKKTKNKKKCTFMEFSEILIYSLKILNQKYVSRNFRYVFVDEFQDFKEEFSMFFSPFLEVSVKGELSLFFVGNRNQNIYSFRGKSRDFETFIDNYEGLVVKKLKLMKNHRCKPDVVSSSLKFIGYEYNSNVTKENLWIVSCKNYKDEKKILIDVIQKHLNDGDSKIRIAVLCRTNSTVNDMQEALINKFKSCSRIRNCTEKNIKNFNVLIGTIHSAKGMEFDHVILVNVNNLEIPFVSGYFINKSDKIKIQHEKNLFYVAITRSKCKVYFLVLNSTADAPCFKNKGISCSGESPFLNDIKEFTKRKYSWNDPHSLLLKKYPRFKKTKV